MKNIIILLAALSLSFTTKAATAVISNQTATNAAVVATPIVLDSLTFYSTNASPTIIRLYDGGITSITGLYTNYTSYTTNLVSSYITTLGTTNLHTNSFVFNQPVINAAATNAATPILTFVVPASPTPVTITPASAIVFTRSLTVSNNLTGVSGIVSYRTQ